MDDEVSAFFERIIYLVERKPIKGEDETQYVYCLLMDYKRLKTHLAHFEIRHVEFQLNWLIKKKVNTDGEYFNWLKTQTAEAKTIKSKLCTKVAMIHTSRRHKFPATRKLKEF